MIGLKFDRQVNTVLCVGAHPDDIEIGALGLIRGLADREKDAKFSFLVMTGDEVRHAEADKSMRSLLGSRGSLLTASFRDGFLPYESPSEVKDLLEKVSGSLSPDVILGPWVGDRHQDHAFLGDLMGQVFRDHFILGYEIAKYDGDLGQPQVFVTLESDQVESKLAHLESHFSSQQSKSWYTTEAFRALLRIRGIECNSSSGFAEAFHVSKLRLT